MTSAASTTSSTNSKTAPAENAPLLVPTAAWAAKSSFSWAPPRRLLLRTRRTLEQMPRRPPRRPRRHPRCHHWAQIYVLAPPQGPWRHRRQSLEMQIIEDTVLDVSRADLSKADLATSQAERGILSRCPFQKCALHLTWPGWAGQPPSGCRPRWCLSGPIRTLRDLPWFGPCCTIASW